MAADNSTFVSLPSHIQRKIDRAFYSAVRSNRDIRQRIPDKQGLNNPIPTGGGFLIEDKVEAFGGGFIIEDPTELNESTHISMSSIPSALQLLDLPPDDEQILSVFRNAASGWSSASNLVDENNIGEGLVSLEDWRTVCAVLFEHHDEEYEDDSEGSRADEAANSVLNDGVDSDDQYLASEDSNDDSDDEYVEGPTASTPRRRTRARKTGSSSSLSPPPSSPKQKKITPRQKQTCLAAFALFFPTVASSELVSQKIMLKDLQRVAKLLGEKIKAEEMVEMVETFSSSPDKSMNLDDFERMMIACRLA